MRELITCKKKKSVINLGNSDATFVVGGLLLCIILMLGKQVIIMP